mmetsp:Transcript_38365/g.97336  ORF Transcript_38365/g.97336 Transcript_38365/m.97336 type:complete len:255 (+) Transcript_38365:217-981(+)
MLLGRFGELPDLAFWLLRLEGALEVVGYPTSAPVALAAQEQGPLADLTLLSGAEENAVGADLDFRRDLVAQLLGREVVKLHHLLDLLVAPAIEHVHDVVQLLALLLDLLVLGPVAAGPGTTRQLARDRFLVRDLQRREACDDLCRLRKHATFHQAIEVLPRGVHAVELVGLLGLADAHGALVDLVLALGALGPAGLGILGAEDPVLVEHLGRASDGSGWQLRLLLTELGLALCGPLRRLRRCDRCAACFRSLGR